MGAIFGAAKGVRGGLLLLLAAAALLGLAWLAAGFAERALGTSFTTGLLLALGLEAFLGVAALFGVASEVQQSHSDAMDDVTPEQRS
jgi:hypothetical protein